MTPDATDQALPGVSSPASRHDAASTLEPYVARVLAEWELDRPGELWAELDATCCYVDISGFTTISERLARLGRLGAEQLTDFLDGVFATMLAIAAEKGGTLLKFGGDSLLLLFSGDGHGRLATEAAVSMRAALAEAGARPTSAGKVSLRASMGLHSGRFHFFAVGETHRELIVAGPATTTTIEMEQRAAPGEILVSDATAALLAAGATTSMAGTGRRLRTRRAVPGGPGPRRDRAVGARTIEAAVPLGLRTWLSGAARDSEHRLATVAFLRFQGTDELLRDEGAPATAAALDRLVTAVQRAVDAEGVTFLASDIDANGGKLIVAAGVPIAQEDDEGRLLRAVRAVVDQRFEVPLQVGVNRDHVFAGDVGGESRRTFTVMGDGVNLAARLAAAAAPGTVLATASVLDYARTEFETTELAPLAIRGKAEPVSTWEVGAATGVKSTTFGFLPFRGRDEELSALRGVLEGLGSATGHVAVVEGERGTGKTRLVTELGTTGGADTVLVMQGEPFGEAIPFLPLRDPVRTLLGMSEATREAAGRQLRDAVARLVPEMAAMAPLLAPLVDAELAATPQSEALGERFVRARLIELLVRVLDATCQGTLLLIAEDAHWFDETTSEICEGLADATEHRNWMLCTTRRPQPGGFSPASPRVGLSLGRLTDSVARELVDAATESAPLRPQERDRLVAQASGNPLFLEELLRIVRSSSLDGLPESLDAIAMREIDALPAAARRVLLTASVLGRVFSRSVLAQLVADEDGQLTDDDLGALSEVLLPDGADGLRFRHALLQEAAYQSLPYRTRLALHCRAGVAIEASAVGADEVAPLLSMHFHAAEDWARTWRYAGLAARVSRLAHAPGEAAVHLDRAVAAGRRLAAVPDDEVAALLVELGDTWIVLGVYDRADDAFRRAALATPQDRVGRARMAERRAYLRTEYLGRLGAAIRQVHGGLAHLDALDAPTDASRRVHAQLVVREAVVRYRQGRLAESTRLSGEAIVESERIDDRRSLALALSMLDQSLAELGRAAEATHMERALAIYEELGDYVDAAMTLGNLGSLAFYQSLWTHADDYFARAAAAATAAGDLATAAVADTNLGELLVNQGDLDGAVELLTPALRTLESFSYRAGIAQATMHLGRARAFLGDAEAGWRLVAASAAMFADAGIQMAALEARAHLAEVLVHAGEHDRAAAELRGARTAERGLGPSPVTSLLDRVEITLLASTGRRDDAVARLEDAIGRARELGATYEVYVLLALEASLGPTTHDDERATLANDLGIVGLAAILGPQLPPLWNSGSP